MTEILVVIHFLIGAPVRETASVAECMQLLSFAAYANDTGGVLARDGRGVITRIACGGLEVETEPKASSGPCEMEAAS